MGGGAAPMGGGARAGECMTARREGGREEIE